MDAFRHIFTALDTKPIEKPNSVVFSYANESGELEHEITWKELASKTDSLSGFLRREKALNLGDRVLLVYPPSIDFVVAFAGCMRAGLVPVPVYPPNPRKFDSGMEAFIKIAHDCDAQLILTSEKYERTRDRGGLKNLAETNPEKWSLDIDWVTTDDVFNQSHPACHGPTPTANDIALIQYTSGSTSAPKGVVLTHGNLSHQVEYNRKGLKTHEETRAVIWVPQYHDLGLIGGIVATLAGYGHLTLFSPFSFIKRPALWFDLLSKMKATITAAPNFAYDLALQKTTDEQRSHWDLSALEVVMSAAEPVRAHTVKNFKDGFANSKFNPKAYLPAYGLAEHTVGITLNGGNIIQVNRSALEVEKKAFIEPNNQNAIPLVSSGSWDETINLKIVDPENHRTLENGNVGEIWVDSPSKAAGYWNMPDKTEESFRASTQEEPNSEYLRTGDLGFVLEGELYICGRIKDMMIIGGRNIYPQDIEDSAEAISHPIKPCSSAAFTVDVTVGQKVEERLVLLVDVKKLRASKEDLESLAKQLQKSILEEHQIACHAIIIAPIGSVLKTTSGKVRRQACSQKWQSGVLSDKALYVLEQHSSECNQNNQSFTPKWPEGASKEVILQTLASQFLNFATPNDIDINSSLIDQGMSSLMAIDFCQAYEHATEQELSVTQFFNHPSISELCRELSHEEKEVLTLDEAFAKNPDSTLIELHALRHYLRYNRYSKTGFRIGDWAVRPATVADVPDIHRLDQQEYGWLGEDATDDAAFIQHQVETLNQFDTPWFWLIEKRHTANDNQKVTAETVGWYIMQPTSKKPSDIKSWANATTNGEFTDTLDPNGKNLYLVAGGISREYTKQAHRLMVLNAISLMSVHRIETVSACLAMPGYSETNRQFSIQPEEYVKLTDSNDKPKDAFLAFFKELWPADHRPMRLLRNGYPPDQLSGGHGVCACVEVSNYQESIDELINILVQQRHALFEDKALVTHSKPVEDQLELA